MNKSQSADARARELLCRVLPDAQWKQFEETGVFEVSGSRGIYQMCRGELTRVLDPRTHRLQCSMCLQLSIPAPAMDRLIAEYVLIRNDENLYWRTANILPGTDNRRLGVVLLLLLDCFLSALLVVQLSP